MLTLKYSNKCWWMLFYHWWSTSENLVVHNSIVHNSSILTRAFRWRRGTLLSMSYETKNTQMWGSLWKHSEYELIEQLSQDWGLGALTWHFPYMPNCCLSTDFLEKHISLTAAYVCQKSQYLLLLIFTHTKILEWPDFVCYCCTHKTADNRKLHTRCKFRISALIVCTPWCIKQNRREDILNQMTWILGEEKNWKIDYPGTVCTTNLNALKKKEITGVLSNIHRTSEQRKHLMTEALCDL